MKLLTWGSPIGLLVGAALVFGTAVPANASVPRSETAPVEIVVSSEGSVADAATITTSIESDLGLTGDAEVIVDDHVIEEVHVEADTADGRRSDTFSISDLTIVDDERFSATLTSESTGETIHVDTTAAETQVLPVVLAVLARVGIQMAIRQFSKAAIQNAARQFALSLNSTKWAHIMATKHNWRYLGATTRTKIADLMSRAVANGRASKARDHIDYVRRYQNRTITVRTSKSGHISNGWVK